MIHFEHLICSIGYPNSMLKIIYLFFACHMLNGSILALHMTFLVGVDLLLVFQRKGCNLDGVGNHLAGIFDFKDRPFSSAPHISDLKHNVHVPVTMQITCDQSLR